MSVFVCGSLHLDVILAAPHLPRLDETVTGQAVTYAFGGKGGNQAVAAARMGAKVAMAGAVGRDDFAERLLADLDRAGVDRSKVQMHPGASGMSAAVQLPNGGYGAVIVSAANLLIDADKVGLPPGVRVLLLQNEISETVNLAVAAKARAQDVMVVLNAAPARPMAARMLALVDLLVVNAVEAADMLGTSDDGFGPQVAAAALSELGPARVIVTLGARGLVLHDGVSTLYPGHAITAVSSHGAGDCFLGALAALLATGAPLAQAVAFGQAAAALYVAAPVSGRAATTPEQVRALARF